MSKADNGKWVEYSDYEKLKEEYDELWEHFGRD
jgi:hypothetical protein